MLILKRTSALRPLGEWSGDDYRVLADCAVVGPIMKVYAAPKSVPWMGLRLPSGGSFRGPPLPTREAANGSLCPDASACTINGQPPRWRGKATIARLTSSAAWVHHHTFAEWIKLNFPPLARAASGEIKRDVHSFCLFGIRCHCRIAGVLAGKRLRRRVQPASDAGQAYPSRKMRALPRHRGQRPEPA
jgi:hypothetical protein